MQFRTTDVCNKANSDRFYPEIFSFSPLFPLFIYFVKGRKFPTVVFSRGIPDVYYFRLSKKTITSLSPFIILYHSNDIYVLSIVRKLLPSQDIA